MLNFDRLSGDSSCIELDFLEREATPEPAMRLGIRLHLAGLSLSYTVLILEMLGVDRHRSTVHRWVQKAELQPTDGADPNHVAVDETVIQLNDERYWLYAAVDPDTNRLLDVRLCPTKNTAITSMFLPELREKHRVDDAEFLVDGAPWLQAACHRHGLRFQHITHGNRNAVKRVFQEVKRRTNQFSNTFSHVEPSTGKNWLQASAFAWNQLIYTLPTANRIIIEHSRYLTMSGELVSIIIPTYYRNNYLREAIRSALDQTYEDVEVIVVDDSGERHAEPVVTTFDEVTYVGLTEHREANGARNVGYQRSSGEYVQFLDDDDRMDERKLEKQVALLSSQDDTGVVYCGIKTDSDVDRPDPEKRGDVLRSALQFDLWPCITSTMLIDSGPMSLIAPLRVRPGSDDTGLIIELATRTKFDFIDEPLLYKRELENSRGRSLGVVRGRKQIHREYAELYDRYPESLRRSALANTHRFKAKYLLRHNRWSAGAVVAYAKECVYSGYDPKIAAITVSSVLGRPGLNAATWAYRRLKDMTT